MSHPNHVSWAQRDGIQWVARCYTCGLLGQPTQWQHQAIAEANRHMVDKGQPK